MVELEAEDTAPAVAAVVVGLLVAAVAVETAAPEPATHVRRKSAGLENCVVCVCAFLVFFLGGGCVSTTHQKGMRWLGGPPVFTS